MIKYESPIAKVVEFEANDIVTVSVPDVLVTWGGNIKTVNLDGETTGNNGTPISGALD